MGIEGWQEWTALGIVAAVALALAWKLFLQFLAEPVSAWLLKRGKVKLAMRFRAAIPVDDGCCTPGGCGATKPAAKVLVKKT